MRNIKLFKGIDALISMLIFYIMSIPFHEWYHYWASVAVKGAGYVTYPAILGGRYEFTTTPMHPWIVYIAGGLGVGLTYFVLWWFQFKTPTRWDMSDEFALAFMGSTQLGYGIGELGWGIWNWPVWVTYVGAIIGAGIAVILYTRRVGDWIADDA